MLTRGRVLLVGCVAMASLVSTVVPARADGWGTVDCAQAPTPQCQLEVGGATAPAPHRPSDTGEEHTTAAEHADGADAVSNCGYRRSGYAAPSGAVGSGLLPSAAWYEGLCSTTGLITTPVQVPTVTPAVVARLARSQLGLPDPDLAASPRGDQLVHLPTWLWLEGGWDTVTTTATVPGVSVTATARPRLVTWSMGEGGTVGCTGPGTPFTPGANPRAASPDCGYTYHRSSAGHPNDGFMVSATVHWSVGWSGAGQSGTFPDLTTTGTTSFHVVESQALNIPPPGR